MNTIEYNHASMDYLINGKPLLSHLKRHEEVEPDNYIPALLSQSLTSERLSNNSTPDLIEGHIAIYLCSHCGQYDGTPIGLKVRIDEDTVTWYDIGCYSDHDESCTRPFDKVREYTFTKENYLEFIKEVKVHEPI
jgi:hypothetical protein